MRTLKVLGTCAAGAAALAYGAYRKDLAAARKRVETGRRFVDSPAGPIEFAVAGDGPAVLLVHGAGGGFDQGLDLGATFLGDGYRFVAPSRFGYLGTPLPADASPEAQADAHLRVLDALQLDTVPVIGVSAGGPSAMQFCLRHPDRCSALVLIVPLAWGPERDTTNERVPPRLLPLLNAVLSSDFLFWTATKVARLALVQGMLGVPLPVYRNAARDERRRAGQMLRAFLPISRRVAGLRNEEEVAANLTRYDLEDLRVPVLVVSAADDLYDTYDSALYTAERVPEAEFIGFPTGGHLLAGHLDEVQAQVARFLKRHAARGARTAMAV